MTKTRRQSAAGLSMVEVMIAMVILAAVMLITYSVLSATSSTAERGQMNSNLEARGRDYIDHCKSLFYDAQFDDAGHDGFLGIHDHYTQVHFQMTVDQAVTGKVVFGYPVDPTKNSAYGVSPPTYQDYSCVIRFEPELVLYEGFASIAPVQPTEEDTSAPQTFRANPYVQPPRSLNPGEPLPTQVLNMDINKNGNKTDVFVKGKIWKYVLKAPLGTPVVYSTERLSDDVILAVLPDGTFMGEVDGPTPAGQPAGKDWLFRYLLAEPIPPTTYGNTDLFMGTAATLFHWGSTDVGLGMTIWHGIVDEKGKGFILHKSWERVPFRLYRQTGPGTGPPVAPPPSGGPPPPSGGPAPVPGP
jgi:prepilin-type N-terminal cleavage/methylation domain-containing protein